MSGYVQPTRKRPAVVALTLVLATNVFAYLAIEPSRPRHGATPWWFTAVEWAFIPIIVALAIAALAGEDLRKSFIDRHGRVHTPSQRRVRESLFGFAAVGSAVIAGFSVALLQVIGLAALPWIAGIVIVIVGSAFLLIRTVDRQIAKLEGSGPARRTSNSAPS